VKTPKRPINRMEKPTNRDPETQTVAPAPPKVKKK
jgi:hypothetical protein